VESIRFDSHMRCFLVRGSGEIVHMVKLGSKPTCSCRLVGSCYHISAVMIATGLKDKVRRPTMNLTLLRQNKRRIKQKAGRKHPRPGDYDVSSAPDAIEKLRASPNREELPGQLPETKEAGWFEHDSDTDFISSIANTESGSTILAHSKKRTRHTKPAFVCLVLFLLWASIVLPFTC
jgi:hypothetical protein